MRQLTHAQLRAEIARCEFCELKPCRDACPVHCSPADFIMAARLEAPEDIARSAAHIYSQNPLGGVCGWTCPETHCMSACTRGDIDRPINIPGVQAAICDRASQLGVMPRFAEPDESNGKRVAVVGAGPAGLAAAFSLARLGYEAQILDKNAQVGGACGLIPEHRLPRRMLQNDMAFVLGSGYISLKLGHEVKDPTALLGQGFDAVIVAVGLGEALKLGIDGEDAAALGTEYLTDPEVYPVADDVVAVVGGGAVACDCALTARHHGARRVELFALEKWSEMPLAERERQDLLHFGMQVNGRTRVASITTDSAGVITGIDTLRVTYPPGDKRHGTEAHEGSFDVGAVEDIPGTEQRRGDVTKVIIAIGNRNPLRVTGDRIFYAGDCDMGPTTVVEASAAGKNAALAVDTALSGSAHEEPPRKNKSYYTIPGYDMRPVPLDADFFGRPIRSPFLLSAAPPTDGYQQMKAAFEAGWAGGIMKTAFDGVPIHIPSEYMVAFGPRTWGNCDNVSGHSLDRVCSEVDRLVREFPEHLVIGSTGGPVTGDDENDSKVWQSNTRKLEAAGAMGIEYSLSCPQGGDGTEGDIVSQSPAVTAKIIDWLLATGDPDVPKLFKLTAAVTSVAVIVKAVGEVLARYPNAKAGVTLANTFPTLKFRPASRGRWEEGVVVGMSGEGVAPISNLTLASVGHLGVAVSGNGGPMDYKAAAHFLALGCKTVQFCTVAMKYGYGILDELESGLSHLMQARGIGSVGELIGIALPSPIRDFMELTPVKKLSAVRPELCVHCGNCSRCSYRAIAMNADGLPEMDASRCVGCSICSLMCPASALYMRERSPEELAALQED